MGGLYGSVDLKKIDTEADEKPAAPAMGALNKLAIIVRKIRASPQI
jgi:hypothetical protein